MWKMESCGIMTELEAKFTFAAKGRNFEVGVRNAYNRLYSNKFTFTGINADLDTSQLKGDHAVVKGTLQP
jgi:hypothetical protein